MVMRRGYSTFIGIDAAINLEFKAVNDEETRCHFCPNNCARTFIDTKTPDGRTSRYISGFSCEKGTVEYEEAMIALSKERKKLMKQFPNLVDYESKQVFRHFYDPEPMPEATQVVSDVVVKKALLSLGVKKKPDPAPFQRSTPESWQARRTVRIGIPKVLNNWTLAPFFRTYFEALGLQKQNVVFSDETTEEMWQKGGKYGSIDPCYPSKVAQAHIHNLLFDHHEQEEGGKKLNYIFFPCITHVMPGLEQADGQGVLPHRRRRARGHEGGVHEGDRLLRRARDHLPRSGAHLHRAELLQAAALRGVGPALGVTEDENDFACQRGVEGARHRSTPICRRRGARSSRRSRKRTASRSS